MIRSLALLALLLPALSHASSAGCLPMPAAPNITSNSSLATRDVSSLVNAELARACRYPNGAVIPNCTVNNPARVRVNNVLLSPDVPPIIINDRMFVEVNAVFSALGYSLAWNGAAQRVTAQRNDMTLELVLGNRNIRRRIHGYVPPDFVVDNGLHPFLATPYNRTLIPLNAVASLTGSEVSWEASTRTAVVSGGSAYFYDRKANGTGADIMLTEHRYVGPGGSAQCPSNQSFDWEVRYCVDQSGMAHGNFPALYRQRAQQLGLPYANSNSWPRSGLLQVIDTAGLTNRTSAQIISEMQSNLEIFGVPFDNHDISTPGIFSVNGGNQHAHQRSETVLPPFVMSGRRQTDQMVRAMYALLPQNIRNTTAFVLPDRLAQDPEAYINYIQSRQNVVLIGSFKGIRDLTCAADYRFAALQMRHHRELFKLRTSLALMNALNRPVIDILYGMGDSKTSFAQGVRDDLQLRLNRTLTAANYGALVSSGASTLTWGADELPAMAMAKRLPTRNVYVHSSNWHALHVWDGLANTIDVVAEKLPNVNLQRVYSPQAADIEVYILNREQGIGNKIQQALPSPDNCIAPAPGAAAIQCRHLTTLAACSPGQSNCRRVYSDDGRFADRGYIGDRANWTVDRAAQDSHDQNFLNMLNQLPPDRRARSIIIDARVPNGAWNNVSAPQSTEWLTFSAWGTFANNLGQALAQGKILHHARVSGAPSGINAVANARRLYLEAVAHDVYANGYNEAQRNGVGRPSLRQKIQAAGVNFVHQMGYSPNDTHTVFTVLNQHVNERMRTHFPSLPANTRFAFNAQFWRTFESEVHMLPVPAGELLIPGLYRLGAVPDSNRPMHEVLSPLHQPAPSDVITRLNLQTLTGNAPGIY